MQTLPKDNLIILLLYYQVIPQLKCPKCGKTLFKKHGFYQRRSIHFYTEIIDIQRHRCLSSTCTGTISIKPIPILPYCRFALWHLVQIDELLKQGLSSYKIAKSLDIPISVILRVQKYLKRVHNFIQSEWKICGHFTDDTFFLQWIGLIKELTWFDLIKRYFQALYPLRVKLSQKHID